MASNKTLAAIAVIVVVVVVAAAAVVMVSSDEKVTGVTYDGNGGTDSDGRTSYTYANETVVRNLFTRDGYTFTGWNTSADGSGTSYSEGDPVSEGTTLYAQWSSSAAFTSISVTGDTSVLSQIYVQIGDGTYNLSTISLYTSSIGISTTESNIILVSTTIGDSWEWVDDTGFTFTYNGTNYALAFTVTGNVTDQAGFMSNDIPAYGFTATGNVGLTVALMTVYIG